MFEGERFDVVNEIMPLPKICLTPQNHGADIKYPKELISCVCLNFVDQRY
jgi:hypothetical protein